MKQALKVWPDLLEELPLPVKDRKRLLDRLPKLRLVQEVSPEFQIALAPDPERREKPVS